MVRAPLLCFILVQALVHYTIADVFLHNPRGSNNRLNGQGGNRQNARRLFDSQNNAKGGYNVGEDSHKASTNWYNMRYYQSGPTAKTILSVEWTNQHGCGDGDLNCDIILQYMCQPSNVEGKSKMRNGEGEKKSQGYNGKVVRSLDELTKRRSQDIKTDAGLHEQWEWYDKCFTRKRNHGLFNPNENRRRSTARFTRQNPKGGRYGYECPEERDYYPYWHPTDWKDIAILTNRGCSYYKKHSFNSAVKGECVQLFDSGKPWDLNTNPWQHRSYYNTRTECEQRNGNWVEFSNYLEKTDLSEGECTVGKDGERLVWAIPYRTEDISKMPGDLNAWKQCLVALDPVDCRKAAHSRSNHLGNGINAKPLTYDWELPYFPSKTEQTCVLRIRYNISTNDYNPQTTFSDQNQANLIENNPTVQIGEDGNALPLKLSINTAQFGRTFQDRTHIFKMVPRKASFMDKTIYNLNARGKRGNIVQVYPAVEYDFVPKRFKIGENDLVHVQFTGSNNNPNNAGQGRARTDRHNLVAMVAPDKSYPLTNTSMFEDAEIIDVMDGDLDVDASPEDLTVYMASAGYFTKANDLPQDVQGCNADQASLLDCFKPSFHGILLKFKKGKYYYMCTRNNSFTNRSQKGRLEVV